jgi:translation initiation factor 3 subunit C
MREGVGKIKNARKTNDWSVIQDEFAVVNKMIEKSKMLILKDGLPNFYIRMLAEVEDHVQLALKDKEAIKKMKAVVSRALNQMKLQVRKHNDTYKTEIADFRANPEKYAEADEKGSDSDDSSDEDSSDEDSDEDESSDEEEEVVKKPKAKAAPVKKVCYCLCSIQIFGDAAIAMIFFKFLVSE